MKLQTWNSTGKDITVKSGSDIVSLKATTSLFARLLVIARSNRDDVDLEDVIGVHELSNTNQILLRPDGTLHPTTDKSKVISLLEDMTNTPDDVNICEAGESIYCGLTCKHVYGHRILCCIRQGLIQTN